MNNLSGYNAILKKIKNLLIESGLEFDELINSGKKLEDFLPEDDDHDEHGSRIEKTKKIPVCFEILEQFYIVIHHIDILLKSGNPEGLKILKHIVDSHRYEEQCFYEKIMKMIMAARRKNMKWIKFDDVDISKLNADSYYIAWCKNPGDYKWFEIYEYSKGKWKEVSHYRCYLEDASHIEYLAELESPNPINP
jgi:hypothetical protein